MTDQTAQWVEDEYGQPCAKFNTSHDFRESGKRRNKYFLVSTTSGKHMVTVVDGWAGNQIDLRYPTKEEAMKAAEAMLPSDAAWGWVEL